MITAIIYGVVAFATFLMFCAGTKAPTPEEAMRLTLLCFMCALIWPVTLLLAIGYKLNKKANGLNE